MISKFLDPRNDLAFKRIFGTPRNADILIHFLNDILDLKEDPIQTVKFLKPNQDPAIAAERQSIVDVLCEDQDHHKFIIEMQVARDPGFIKRAQYYASKTYINQRDDGVDYKDLKNIRFLAIYDEMLFSKKNDYISYHEMRDIKTQENDLDTFKFIFLELSKFKNKKEDLKTITQKWAYFFKYASETREEDLAEIVGSDFIIEKAYNELDRFGWSKEDLMEYDAVDMKISAVKDALEESRLEGREEGRIEGKIEGKIEGRIEGWREGREEGEILGLKKTLCRMYKMDMDVETISQATGLIPGEVERIIQEEKLKA